MIELMFLKELILITQAHQKSDFCHYWYFLNCSFKFHSNVWNNCHDLLMVSVNLNYIAVLNIKSFGYCCIISLISKSEAINWGKMRQNADLTEKTGTL